MLGVAVVLSPRVPTTESPPLARLQGTDPAYQGEQLEPVKCGKWNRQTTTGASIALKEYSDTDRGIFQRGRPWCTNVRLGRVPTALAVAGYTWYSISMEKISIAIGPHAQQAHGVSGSIDSVSDKKE